MLIGSVPAYQAQCTLPPHPIYQTHVFNFSRVWFRASSKFSYKECGSIICPGLHVATDLVGVATGLVGVTLHTLTLATHSLRF